MPDLLCGAEYVLASQLRFATQAAFGRYRQPETVYGSGWISANSD
ncbi:hypothetical protein [Kingella oralis]|nr:hypothetical protein [Kingella oralis]